MQRHYRHVNMQICAMSLPAIVKHHKIPKYTKIIIKQTGYWLKVIYSWLCAPDIVRKYSKDVNLHFAWMLRYKSISGVGCHTQWG